ncbi:SDR family oxidoreductase [Olivibacter sp. SDN3]|uniref:NAD(P)-dependent oxidoreductase n=1 Tax=Olivibacter sp. SDN3 TaxID=2764720 RepID=UPI0016519EA7|nr:SDR family oxidoreductase [Olivibacter sp. SDN3]QNL51023.1 SDR family oxidoreductase [Olivibacter sp. SDN3]
MNIVVFGSTGSVGTHIVKQALEKGFQVRAFTRRPEKLAPQARLEVFKGDLMDRQAVEKAVSNQDAVLCAIGDGGKGGIRALGTRHIIDAMQTVGIRRIICETTLGLGESKGNLNFFWKYIMFGLLLKKAFNDHKLQEEYLFKSNLDYTIVRPAAFSDGAQTANFKVGFDGNAKGLSLKIARADVAGFMLRELETGQYVKKPVSISN